MNAGVEVEIDWIKLAAYTYMFGVLVTVPVVLLFPEIWAAVLLVIMLLGTFFVLMESLGVMMEIERNVTAESSFGCGKKHDISKWRFPETEEAIEYAKKSADWLVEDYQHVDDPEMLEHGYTVNRRRRVIAQCRSCGSKWVVEKLVASERYNELGEVERVETFDRRIRDNQFRGVTGDEEVVPATLEPTPSSR